MTVRRTQAAPTPAPHPRAVPEAQERPLVIRALSTFTPAEQRAILALVAAADSVSSGSKA
jgi:hypothetical protein